MGSTASKASRAAAGTRVYPTRIPPTTSPITARKNPNPDPAISETHNTTSSPSTSRHLDPITIGPTVHPPTHTTTTRDDAITRDASDPDLALNARMRQLGPVQPNPTYSHSSTFAQAFARHVPLSNSSALKPAPTRQGRGQPQSQSSTPAPSAFSPSSPAGHTFTPSASTPSQTLFPSAQNNPAVLLLAARERLAEEAEREFEEAGRLGRGLTGRRFLDVGSVMRIVQLREDGRSEASIEEGMGLRSGLIMETLGRKGVVHGNGGFET